jgi:hypothetical protein
MPDRPSRLTAEDLADLPEDDGTDGCDFGTEIGRPWPVNVGGVWRPQGARALGVEAELELV